MIPCTCALVMSSVEKERRVGTFMLLFGVMCLLRDVHTTALNQGRNISDIATSEKEDGVACLDLQVFLISVILWNRPDCRVKHMQAGGFWLVPQCPGCCLCCCLCFFVSFCVSRDICEDAMTSGSVRSQTHCRLN